MVARAAGPVQRKVREARARATACKAASRGVAWTNARRAAPARGQRARATLEVESKRRAMNQPIASMVEREVRIPTGDGAVVGDLVVPAGAKALVVFAHGSGSSRRSPRNVWVAEQLHREAIATLLFDLLTAAEERRDVVTAEHRFDIALLGRRLMQAIDWTGAQADLVDLPLGAFGASTGSAAALVAAAQRPDRVRAVVSRGGRPDLAGADVLPRVQAATLLVVGGRDDVVLDLNERALALMTCEKRLEIVPGATHLFEERGALERVAALAAGWFVEYLVVETGR
jgi:putative phosphoribosyl transferase